MPVSLTFGNTDTVNHVVQLLKILQGVSAANLVRALVAILAWSLFLGLVSVVYELWRLVHNWRLAIA